MERRLAERSSDERVLMELTQNGRFDDVGVMLLIRPWTTFMEILSFPGFPIEGLF